MSYSPSLGLLVAHSAEYVEETTFGTQPTNPTWNWIGTDLQYSDTADMGSILIRNLGTEDLKSVVKGADNYDVTLDYALQASTFLKYLVNSQGGGAGSIDKSLSVLISPKISGTTNYLEALGCRPDSGSIKWQLGKELRGNLKLFAQSISAYTSTDPTGTGSHASDPGTTPWVFTDPGASGITFGGTAYDIQDMTVNFNRNLQRVRAIGQSTAKYIVPSIRDITFDVTIMLEATANYSALLNNTSQTIAAPLKNGTSILTLSNAFFQKQGKSIQVKDVIYEKYTGVAESASLT
ncbi:MAG TPA: phage tail tube protein [Nitrososphaerales archaeon]|nr:phage tail tube protein [Nitrososphaerales archaeon]